jgi:hypothetical protein
LLTPRSRTLSGIEVQEEGRERYSLGDFDTIEGGLHAYDIGRIYIYVYIYIYIYIGIQAPKGIHREDFFTGDRC